MDTANRRPFDVVLFCISLAILVIASIPSFLPKFARVLSVLLVGFVHYRIIFTQTTGDLAGDLALGSAFVAQYLLGAHYALFTPPETLKDYRDGDAVKVAQRSLKKRLQWTLRLYSNPRGIGWADEPRHLPPRPSASTPRRKFISSKIFFAIGCFSVVGVMVVVNASNPGLTTPGMLLSEAPLHWRVLGVTCFGLSAIASISALNAILAMVVVGCGFSSPERWPWFFGSPFQVWSIRGFWRRFWHQAIRRIVLGYSSLFLGYIFPASETRSIRYRLATVYTAFFISGVIHMAGDAMVTGRIIFKAFTFFMLQPFGITIEVCVSYLWHQFSAFLDNIPPLHGNGAGNLKTPRGGDDKERERKKSREPIPPVWIRCVGFIWLVFWMTWTAPHLIDTLCVAGVFTNPSVDLRRFMKY